MTSATGQPVLTLHGASEAPAASTGVPAPQPVTATDPRWVLAVRVHETLEGTLLRPEARRRLERMGRMMGLNRFQVSLVIAIVQDQAHRGEALSNAAPTLAMIPRSTVDRRRVLWRIVGYIAALLAVELAVLWLFLG